MNGPRRVLVFRGTTTRNLPPLLPAREAVAWTFNLEPWDYRPVVET